jgi:transglutaminase-like putative cysteine protease
MAALFVAAGMGFVAPFTASAVETPATFKLLTSEIVVEADGTYTERSHTEILARNDSAAKQVAQAEVAYSESSEDLDVVEAYTLKPDGRRLPVAPSAIYVQTPQYAKSVPIDDRKQKLIVFPDVAAGDVVVYTTKMHVRQPFFPGYFINSDSVPRTLSIDEGRATIVVPKSMPLKVETHGLEFKKEEGDKTITYRWTFHQPDALVEDNSQLADLDVHPRYFASSFKDYDEVARVYAAIVAPLMAVTPKIQAQADTITAGISDRRQQAEKIHHWVSAHISYLSIDLGAAAVAPRSAETVLANGYGDSRDHAVILAALLKAKGIDNEIALINSGNGYSLSEAPAVPGQLNHALVWLPEFRVYTDTTVGVAPFGTLVATEYGKPALHIVTSGNALRRTPVLPAGSMSISVKTVAKMDSEGGLTGDTKTVATGAAEISLRFFGREIEDRGPENAAAAQLQALGYPGATGTFDLASPTEPSADYSIAGHFEVAPQPQYVSGASFDIFGGLRLFSTTGDWMMGPLWNYKVTENDPTPCYSGHTEEELSLELPAGKHLVKLPSDSKIVDKHAEFTGHWSMEGQTVTVKRDFKVMLDQPLCEGDSRKEAAKLLAAIRDSFNTAQLTLADD